MNVTAAIWVLNSVYNAAQIQVFISYGLESVPHSN